jgi:hypothetical protein
MVWNIFNTWVTAILLREAPVLHVQPILTLFDFIFLIVFSEKHRCKKTVRWLFTLRSVECVLWVASYVDLYCLSKAYSRVLPTDSRQHYGRKLLCFQLDMQNNEFGSRRTLKIHSSVTIDNGIKYVTIWWWRNEIRHYLMMTQPRRCFRHRIPIFNVWIWRPIRYAKLHTKNMLGNCLLHSGTAFCLDTWHRSLLNLLRPNYR